METQEIVQAETPQSPEEKIQQLSEEVKQLSEIIVEVDQSFKNMFSVLQRLLGVKIVYDKNTNQYGCVVEMPKGGKRGVVAELYEKMQKLWKNYGGEIIIPKGVFNGRR